MNIILVSVVTNFNQYRRLFENNKCLAHFMLRSYDNTETNLPIPIRYNSFINENLPQDSWIIFCHQDFEFLQDPKTVLKDLDKNCIYGPIGVGLEQGTAVHLIFHPFRWKPSLHKMLEFRGRWGGEIRQGTSNGSTYLFGNRIKHPLTVDTVDCCCLIVHSSLIRKYQLKFDPLFDFHLYSEDFSLAARKKGIVTKAIQIECCHHSNGNRSEIFWKKYDQLLAKYPDQFFLTTCVGTPQASLERILGKRYATLKHLFQGAKLSNTYE